MKLRTSALALALALAGTAHATSWNNVVVLGDSLSDAGTFKAIAGAGGKFTTNPGPVWSEHLASALGTTPAPARLFTGSAFVANPGGNNWAQGGARVTGTPGVGVSAAQPVSVQLANYLAQGGGRADGGTLHAVWAGANDIFFWSSPATNGGASAAAIQANVAGAAQALVQQLATLQAAGGRQLIVFNLPDMGRTPAALASGPSAATALSGLAQLYNLTLSNGIVAGGVQALQLDSFRLLNEIIANPAAYGFTVTNTATACLPAGSSSLSCTAANLATPGAAQTFMFADGVHPTTAAHRILGDYALAALRAPALVAQVADQSTRTLDVQWRGQELRQRRFLDGQQAEGGGDVYVSGQVSDVSGNGVEGNPYGLTLGADRNFGDGWFGGLSVSLLRDRIEAGGVGKARGNGIAVSLYGSKRLGALWLSGSATLASVDHDLDRDVALGIASRRESASVSGTSKGLRFEAGYDLASGPLRHGPFAGIAYRRIDLNSFQDQSGNATALRFGEQQFDQLRGSLGYLASWQASERLRLSGRVSLEHEFSDSYRDLAVGVAGTAGNLIQRVGRDRGSYGEASLAATWSLDRDSSLGAALTLGSTLDGTRQHSLFVQYGMRF